MVDIDGRDGSDRCDAAAATPVLRCDGAVEGFPRVRCDRPVDHVDHRGFAYCRTHGLRCQAGGERCRRLTPTEIATLQAGGVICY